MNLSGKAWKFLVVLAIAAMGSLAGASAAWAAANKDAFTAGYYAGPGGITSATSASAKYVLPKVTCLAGENAAIGPAAEVYDSATGATAHVTADVRLECIKGTPTYLPRMDVNGTVTLPALTVLTGDKVKVSVTQNGSGASAEIQDLTTGMSASATGTGSTTDTYANIQMLWVPRPNNPNLPQLVPNFGHLAFTSAKINGLALGSLNYGETEMYSGGVDPVPAGAHLLISTSAVSGGTFTTTFVQSS